MLALPERCAGSALELPGLTLRAAPVRRRRPPSSTCRSTLASARTGRPAAGIGGARVRHRPVRRARRSSAMPGTWCALLAAVGGRRPSGRSAAWPLLGAAERAQLLVDVERHRARRYPAPPRARAVRGAGRRARPTRSRVVFEEQRADLRASSNARANRLAHHLLGCGVGPETRGRALRCERSAEHGRRRCSAVLKAGGAYVPLDPELPGRRGWRSCSPTPRAPVLLTHAALRGRLPADGAGARAPRRRRGRRSPAADDAPGIAPCSRSTWPTSSTPPARPARPRASCVTHRGAAEPGWRGSIDALCDRRRATRVLQFASLELRRLRLRDLSAAAGIGATLVRAGTRSAAGRRAGGLLADRVEQRSPTRLVPPVLAEPLAEPTAAGAARR